MTADPQTHAEAYNQLKQINIDNRKKFHSVTSMKVIYQKKHY